MEVVMFWKSIVCVLVLSSLSVVSGNFFQNALDKGARLPDDKLYPQGRIFPYTGFSPHKRDLEQIKKSGFTALGPVYGRYEEFLATCKEVKMPCIYGITVILPDGKKLKKDSHLSNSKWTPDWQYITDYIKKIVKKHASDPNVAWWYIAPEEIRYWRKNELEYLKRACAAIHEADPMKRPVWMYSPGHRNDKAMAKVAKYLDVLGKGCYTGYSKQKDSRIWVKWTIDNQLGALKLVGDKKKISILVPEMFWEPKAEDKKKIRDWIRHDVYLGLMSGAKGVFIFSLWPRRNFPSHKIWLNAYCEVASELTQKQNLGQVFLFGTPKKDLKMKVLSGPETASCDVRIRKMHKFTYSSVNFTNIALKDKRYLLAANSANEPVTVQFSGFPGVTAVDAFTGKAVSGPEDGKLKLIFKPLEVKGFIFSKK
jgi:hypothetical protein